MKTISPIITWSVVAELALELPFKFSRKVCRRSLMVEVDLKAVRVTEGQRYCRRQDFRVYSFKLAEMTSTWCTSRSVGNNQLRNKQDRSGCIEPQRFDRWESVDFLQNLLLLLFEQADPYQG
jgi:hypothetical protein